MYDVATWKKTIAIHILPSISRSKGNQTMKFGQLIEYKMLFYRVCFYCMASLVLSKYIENKLQTTCTHPIYGILKNKRRFGTSLQELVWLLLLRQILGNMCIVIVCWLGCDAINFPTNHIFLIKPFFLLDQKFKTKVSISWERKEISR